jgi:hypothetical protein
LRQRRLHRVQHAEHVDLDDPPPRRRRRGAAAPACRCRRWPSTGRCRRADAPSRPRARSPRAGSRRRHREHLAAAEPGRGGRSAGSVRSISASFYAAALQQGGDGETDSAGTAGDEGDAAGRVGAVMATRTGRGRFGSGRCRPASGQQGTEDQRRDERTRPGPVRGAATAPSEEVRPRCDPLLLDMEIQLLRRLSFPAPAGRGSWRGSRGSTRTQRVVSSCAGS